MLFELVSPEEYTGVDVFGSVTTTVLSGAFPSFLTSN